MGEIWGSQDGEYEDCRVLGCCECSLTEVYERFRASCCAKHHLYQSTRSTTHKTAVFIQAYKKIKRSDDDDDDVSGYTRPRWRSSCFYEDSLLSDVNTSTYYFIILWNCIKSYIVQCFSG